MLPRYCSPAARHPPGAGSRHGSRYSPYDWSHGLLTESGILRNGTVFTEAYAFSHDGLTNLLFPFQDGVDIDVGRIAVWRLATHEQFGGTWLSDYIPNRLEDSDSEQPVDDSPVMNQ